MLMNPSYVERVLDDYLNAVPGISDVDQRSMTNLFYHTRRHVENMLTGFEFHVLNRTWDPISGPAVMIGEAAILFHDIVYVPGSCENEERSAAYAEKRLHEIGFPDWAIQSVKELILYTIPFTDFRPETGRNKELGWIADLIHDLDWIGFSNYDVMKANEEKIACEAMHKANTLFKGGKIDFQKAQIAFYEKLLNKMDKNDGLYLSDHLACYNDVVRTNVETRISELKFEE